MLYPIIQYILGIFKVSANLFDYLGLMRDFDRRLGGVG
jgi:hypothetical protein